MSIPANHVHLIEQAPFFSRKLYENPDILVIATRGPQTLFSGSFDGSELRPGEAVAAFTVLMHHAARDNADQVLIIDYGPRNTQRQHEIMSAWRSTTGITPACYQVDGIVLRDYAGAEAVLDYHESVTTLQTRSQMAAELTRTPDMVFDEPRPTEIKKWLQGMKPSTRGETAIQLTTGSFDPEQFPPAAQATVFGWINDSLPPARDDLLLRVIDLPEPQQVLNGFRDLYLRTPDRYADMTGATLAAALYCTGNTVKCNVLLETRPSIVTNTSLGELVQTLSASGIPHYSARDQLLSAREGLDQQLKEVDKVWERATAQAATQSLPPINRPTSGRTAGPSRSPGR